jgi:hypothetical protein
VRGFHQEIVIHPEKQAGPGDEHQGYKRDEQSGKALAPRDNRLADTNLALIVVGHAMPSIPVLPFLHVLRAVNHNPANMTGEFLGRAASFIPSWLPRKPPRFAAKLLRADSVSALLRRETTSMKTMAVIFLLALAAVAGSIYTDMLFTSAQAVGTPADLPMMHGQSITSDGWR